MGDGGRGGGGGERTGTMGDEGEALATLRAGLSERGLGDGGGGDGGGGRGNRFDFGGGAASGNRLGGGFFHGFLELLVFFVGGFRAIVLGVFAEEMACLFD